MNTDNKNWLQDALSREPDIQITRENGGLIPFPFWGTQEPENSSELLKHAEIHRTQGEHEEFITKKWDFGKVYITGGINEKFILSGNKEELLNIFMRFFFFADWGDDMYPEDLQANNEVLAKGVIGGGLYGWYNTSKGRVMVVSYIGRESTILLEEEY